MYQDIHKYITKCKTCQFTKRDVHAKKDTMHPLPIQDAFSRWHMDILADLPKAKEGYQYIPLMIDSFSHWCECVPLQSQDTSHVAKVLYKEIFTRYDYPLPFYLTGVKIVYQNLVHPYVPYLRFHGYAPVAFIHRQTVYGNDIILP
jgi:hypothetical protein